MSARDVTAVAEPSAPAAAHDVRVEFADVPVRDGTVLSLVVYRERGASLVPALVMATPYDKMAPQYVEWGRYFGARGYALVVVDIRGRYESQGEPYLYGPHDGEDLHDVIEWIAAQEWCTGRVGTFGGSYLGFIQLTAALERPPSHACMAPRVAPDDHYDNVFPSGAFQLANSIRLAWRLSRRTNQNSDAHADWDAIARHLPLRTLDTERLGFESRVWRDFVAHPARDEFWTGPGERLAPGRLGAGRYDRIAIPSLHISGWYDQVSQATINNYLGVVRHGPRALRDSHRLVMGPWTHRLHLLPEREWGDRELPEQARIDVGELLRRWFDRWLHDAGDGSGEAAVRIFVIGDDEWRDEREWPLRRAAATELYLRGGGGLGTEPPGDEPPAAFVYDPRDPVPTLGGNLDLLTSTAGPRDQRPLDGRPDVLTYLTEPLAAPLEATGPVRVELFAASDATDTDFTAKLVDVHPDGYAPIVLEGIVRARYRHSFRNPEPLVPGRAERFLIDLWSTSYVFGRGHRIRLDVSSSNFPKYDRNPNTGRPFGLDEELRPARQTVYHDRMRPSRLVLPVVPRAEGGRR